MIKSAFLLPLLYKVNAWQIRMVALTCLVLFVGCGSQALVNAFAASQPQTTPVATPVVQFYQVAPLPSSHCTLLIRRSIGGFVSDDLHVRYSFRQFCIHENNVVKSLAR